MLSKPPPQTHFYFSLYRKWSNNFLVISPNCEQLFRFLSCVIFTNVYTQRLICIFWKGYICSPRTLNGSAVTIFSPVAIVNIHCFPSIIPIRHRNHIYCTAVIIGTRRWLPLEAWCMRAQALSVNLFHKRVAEKHLIWLWNYTDEIDGPKIIENKCYVALVFA